MRAFVRRRLCLAVLVVGALPALAQGVIAGPVVTPKRLPGPPWWKNEQFKKDLALTVEQVDRIDKIWLTTKPDLRQEWDEFSRLDEKLSKLIQADADEAVLARQIDRVETARAAASKTRSLMLVRMLKVLTAEQRVKFKGLHDRWEQDRLQQQPNGKRSED
jgi:Spy/CpxP family protein refolding chaperone